MLLQVVDNLSDEKLAKMMPYTQMIIRTNDGGALAHEDEIAQAVDYDYSAIVDRKSVQGLVRLDSELDQHQAFAYVFVVIFVGIAVLVIATSMGRIVEKQRIQIGTMNALGMKRWKIVLHYISYSLLVSVLGVIVGLAGGVGLGAPAMIGMFEQYYIVPGSIGLSRKLAADMGIKVGDTIYWHIYSKNEWYGAVVGVIYRSCETQGIAYLREDYEKTGAEYTPTLLMTDDAGAKDVAALKYVTSVNSREDMIAAYEKSMEVINIMVFAMVIFSTVMIVVVLYNSGSLSFNERMKELATLKVMGLQSAQIRRLLTVQNIWLSIIGIIIGTPLGNMSLNAMMNSNGENFDYSLSVPVIDYIIAAIVLIISMLVSFMFTKRIKKLDLVETLKDVE
jgi:ABC-type antimicrobial peptide transport system permease subunit